MQIARLHPDWPKTEAAKQGMLGKRGRGNIKSKPRWFVLKHRFLYYYDSSAVRRLPPFSLFAGAGVAHARAGGGWGLLRTRRTRSPTG
jgi:hypothetical protein